MIRSQLREAPHSYSYDMIAAGGREREREREREKETINYYVRYLGPQIGLSRDCHGRIYVVSSGGSTAGKSGRLHVLEASREVETTRT